MRTETLKSEEGCAIACPKCGQEIMSAEATSVKLEVTCGSARDSQLKLSCGCAVWVEDIDRFNRDSGYRSLRYGCFTENLIPPGERIRIFSYVDANVEGMLSHLGYQMTFEEMPSAEEMDDEDGSYPICSGEQIWVRGMSTAYVGRQYCGYSGFSGDTHIAVVGTIKDWRQVANLIDLHYERKEKQERGEDWNFLVEKWWMWRRQRHHADVKVSNKDLIEKIFEISQGFRRIFGQV